MRRRLTVAFVLVAGVAAAVLALGSYLLVQQARLDDSLDQAAVDARYQLVLARQFLPLDDDRSAELLASFEGSGRHVILAPGATPTASNPAFAPALGIRLREIVASGQLGYERTPGRLVVGGRIPGSTAELYVVRVEDRIHRDLGQLRDALVAGWVVVVLLAAAIGHALARRTLEPVGRASRAARSIAEGLLSTRLPVTGRDEFGAWALSFNEMADALEAKIGALSAAQARERRFTADVAHELRTPVTALVGEAALLRERLAELPPDLRRPAQLVVSDTVRLRRLVEDLMEISRLDAGQEPVQIQPVDVPAAIRAAVAARGWGSRVTVTGDQVVLRTDTRRLDRILANVIANAVEHGGGGVRVVIRAAGAGATVIVADQGPGIAPEHLPHLFDRFYKADPARSGRGSGLGLAIAGENARLLGATLAVRSEPGAGTELRVELPAEPPDGGPAEPPDGGPAEPPDGRPGGAA